MKTLLDIFKLAIFNEVQAQLLYRMAAEITDDDEARMWFIEFAGSEEEHADELIRRTEKSPTLDGFDARAFLAELRAATTARLGLDDVKTFRKGSIERVLRFAKELETKSRDNYLALATGVDSTELRALFRSLAAEEQGHYNEICRIETILCGPAGHPKMADAGA